MDTAGTEHIIDAALAQHGSVELLWRTVAGDAHANAKMMLRLGQCYDLGTGGLRQSQELAVACYRVAARSGEPRACLNLGACLAAGYGGEELRAASIEQQHQDDRLVEAVRWYRAAAEAGNAQAMCNLGICFERGGEGVGAFRGEAVRWYRLAAAEGNKQAALNLIAIGEREAAVIGESEREQLAVLAAGCVDGAMAGAACFDAALVTRNAATARLLLEQAARFGVAAAHNNLGVQLAQSGGGSARSKATACFEAAVAARGVGALAGAANLRLMVEAAAA
eukprot:SAG22_NODE_481_length_9943_cov_50.747562_2_plen_280_part_00